MLYLNYEIYKKSLSPFKNVLNEWISLHDQYKNYFLETPISKIMNAESKFFYEWVKDYPKPQFNIQPIQNHQEIFFIEEKIIHQKSFCDLKLFETTNSQKQKKGILIVAPLSGHYATLLKDTVKSFVQDFDVYITDWKNCRDISLDQGNFHFSTYMDYLIEFNELIKKKHGSLHVIAVCQPTVPVLASTAYMSLTENNYQPDSLTLMGGPVDTRISPTQVNEYAFQHDIHWFQKHVIDKVPAFYDGFGRKVYPGFLQYYGFVSMNMSKHTKAHLDFFNHLLQGADLDAQKHQEFYSEYNAVMDLPADYYLETLENVFIDQKLAKGTLTYNNITLSLDMLKSQKIFTIEGELDDISGAGQTHITQKLAKNIDSNNKKEITVPKVGHYGIFAGKTWREIIYPEIKKFIIQS
jgi:poly(3-hydroxybutyrate) depolymerase